MTRKSLSKEAFYHVYHKGDSAKKSRIVMRVSKSGLECLTKGLSNESIINYCGLYLDKGKLKSNKDYIATEISAKRANKKIEASKYESFSINYHD